MTTPTFSIVIETDNLALATLGDLRACLDSLAAQRPALDAAEGVFLVDAGQVPEAVARTLGRDYPWLTLASARPETLYVGLKEAGAARTDSDLIVFCDADVRYAPGWLEALLAPFSGRPEVEVVAGETSTPLGGPFDLAFALTFNFPRFSGEQEVVPSAVYWANNVALRRALLESCPIPDPSALYRGQNILHTAALTRRGVTVWRQPRARAEHVVLPPRVVLGRYRVLGRDGARLGRLTRESTGAVFLPVMPPDRVAGHRPLRKLADRLRQVALSAPRHLLWLPLALPCVVLFGAFYLWGRVEGGPAASAVGSEREPGGAG